MLIPKNKHLVHFITDYFAMLHNLTFFITDALLTVTLRVRSPHKRKERDNTFKRVFLTHAPGEALLIYVYKTCLLSEMYRLQEDLIQPQK